jgi:hypothetical protein
MKKFNLATVAGAALLLTAGAASAQTTVIETTGTMPPDEVVTYVQRDTIPSVQAPGDVIVGYTVPGTVQLRTVPRYVAYSYAIVNDRRVIVEPRTRRVIRVVE